MSPLCRMINLPFANSVPKITPFIIAGLVDIMTYCSGVFWAHLSTESLFDTKGKNLLTLQYQVKIFKEDLYPQALQ